MMVAWGIEPSVGLFPFFSGITAGVALVWEAVVVVAVLHETAVEVVWVNQGRGGLFALAQGVL